MIDVDELEATISGGELWYVDRMANSDKVYQGHLTFLAAEGGWIAWASYGRRGQWREALLNDENTMRDITELQAQLRERESKIQPWQQPTPEAIAEMKANETWASDGTFMDGDSHAKSNHD